MRAYLLPAPGDAESWAKITAGILQTAWATSAQLRQHPPETIYDGMFAAQLSHLDGYSRYTDAMSADQARASREGFGGIGITVEDIEGHTRVARVLPDTPADRSEEHTSELQSLMRNSYAVFCLKKK